MSKKLTDKQEMFCREYLLDLNATQAAIRAGYSEKTANRTATKLLSKAVIQDRISELKNARNEKTEINTDYVLRRLKEIDELDVLDIMLDDLSAFKPLNEWPKAWRISISGIDMKRIVSQRDDEPMDYILEKVKWPDKVKNLGMIGRHVDVGAWEKDTAPVVVSNNIMPVPTAASAEEWEKAAQAQQDKSLSRS